MPPPKLSDRKRKLVLEKVENLLAYGAVPLKDVAHTVALLDDVDVDEAQVEPLVAECFQKLAPPKERPTALERVEAVFAVLEKHGVMARHYPTLDPSDAEALVNHELAIARARGQTYMGYCYYDRWLVADMENGELSFRYGPAGPVATFAELWHAQWKIGNGLLKAFGQAGFKAVWRYKPLDPVAIVEVDFRGGRDPEGAPLVPIGQRLESATPVPPLEELSAGLVRNVYVSSEAGTDLAHRLIKAISLHAGVPGFVSEKNFEHLPAAVAVPSEGQPTLDFVTAISEAGIGGSFASKDLAWQCEVLVAVAATPGAPTTTWWTNFAPERRLLVVTSPAAVAHHQGSRVLHVDLTSLKGLAELLDAVRALLP